MAGRFRDVIRTIEAMRADGVISEYAIVGAVAFIVWDEPIATDDLDVSCSVRRGRVRAPAPAAGDQPDEDREGTATRTHARLGHRSLRSLLRG